MLVFGGIMGYESFLSGATGWVAVGSNVVKNSNNFYWYTMSKTSQKHVTFIQKYCQ